MNGQREPGGAGFFAFLQKRWTGYLAGQQPAGTLVQESGLSYDTGDLLPFDEPDVRAYVGTLFLEGKLKPVSPPEDWTIEGWAQVGVEFDERAFELRRFTGLLEHLERELPDDAATHRDWKRASTPTRHSWLWPDSSRRPPSSGPTWVCQHN